MGRGPVSSVDRLPVSSVDRRVVPIPTLRAFGLGRELSTLVAEDDDALGELLVEDDIRAPDLAGRPPAEGRLLLDKLEDLFADVDEVDAPVRPLDGREGIR